MTQNFRGWICSLIVLAICSCFTQCANIVPPGGGARDTLPPQLLRVAPKDSSLNFASQRVTFQFSEFVELDNVIDKLIVSPTLKRSPTITAKLRTITLEIKDSLQPNTTYTFNFGDAVKDVNERNPIEDFQYVVSTGTYLDSLQLGGKLLTAETGKIDSNITVMLYSNLEDSAVSKEKPLYVAKTKGNGFYRFKNLKPGTYRVFAIKEEDRDFQYTQTGVELIAFADSLVHLTENTEGINLALFKEIDTAKPFVDMEPVEPPPTPAKDKNAPKKPKLVVGTSVSGGKQELGDSLTIQFNFPIRTIDSSQILLLEDTTRRQVPFTFHRTDTLNRNFKILYNWKPTKPYTLILPAGLATDTTGLTTLKADTVHFAAKGLDDYGIVRVKLGVSDSARNVLPADTNFHYVVQLISGNEIKYAGRIVNGGWERGLIQPGEYEIRVLIDLNGNDIWDTGSYYVKPRRQPEKVFSIHDKINIKKNWTVPVNLNL